MPRQGGRTRPLRRRSWTKDRYCGRRQLEASSGNSEFFKLLRGASEAQHPSSPSQLYLAIASIFSFSVCRVKEFLHPNRPYVNVQIGPAPAAALYDSGAYISCLSENEFRKILLDRRPSKILGPGLDSCFGAGGAALTVTGIYNLPISVLGLSLIHI